jgi:menaquinone-dependent protoporphyrinogen oxidase
MRDVPTGAGSFDARPAPRVLVVFASRHGATRETAATVARELTRAGRARGGLSVVLAPVQRQPDAVAFDAVVLGSGVYSGRWLEPALDWVGRMSAQLRDRPVWLFSTGVRGVLPPARGVGDGRWVADALGAREHRSFDGRVEHRLLSPAERAWFPVEVPDRRDRTAVRDWSVRIAAEIAGRPALARVG